MGKHMSDSCGKSDWIAMVMCCLTEKHLGNVFAEVCIVHEFEMRFYTMESRKPFCFDKPDLLHLFCALYSCM